MAHLLSVIVTATGAFVGTNVDDLVALFLLILGMPKDQLRTWQIFAGQYVGFAVLIIVSLGAAAALHGVPGTWAGLLGLVPIALGVVGLVRLVRRRHGTADDYQPILVNGVIPVTIITVANGADNVSVYTLLFRGSAIADVVVTIAVFLVLLAVWCTIALAVGRRGRVLFDFIRVGQWLAPIVFLLIGVTILLRNGELTYFWG